MQILMGTEPQGERCGGRIIDHPMQGRQGAAVLEPGERAGVELGQLAERRFARAPAAMLRGRPPARGRAPESRSEEHTSELQSQSNLVCRLLLEKKKKK